MDCTTCLYKDDCTNGCIGYVEDEATSEARAAYEELQADIERDERAGE